MTAPAFLAPDVTAEVLHGSLDGPVLVARVMMAAGAVLPEETHAEYEEHITVVAGIIERTTRRGDEATTWRVGADERFGATCTIYNGRPHIIRNASQTEAAEYIAILRRQK